MAVENGSNCNSQTCYQFNVPFVVVRLVSDLANGEAENELQSIFKKAAVSSSQTVEAIRSVSIIKR